MDDKACWVFGCKMVTNTLEYPKMPSSLLLWVLQLQPVFEKTCATTQKNVKSNVFLKSEKNVKKRWPTAYVQFHRPLNHSAFNTQLPKPKLSTCTGKSSTSHTLLGNAEQETNMQLTCRCVIVKRLGL